MKKRWKTFLLIIIFVMIIWNKISLLDIIFFHQTLNGNKKTFLYLLKKLWMSNLFIMVYMYETNTLMEENPLAPTSRTIWIFFICANWFLEKPFNVNCNTPRYCHFSAVFFSILEKPILSSSIFLRNFFQETFLMFDYKISLI